MPPPTTTASPLIATALGEHRNATVHATSCASTMRPSRLDEFICASTSCGVTPRRLATASITAGGGPGRRGGGGSAPPLGGWGAGPAAPAFSIAPPAPLRLR